MNLCTIRHLAESFGVPTGLSDHTLGIAVPVTAVTHGACIIEKHLTLSRSTPGPDSAFSLEPNEFHTMVEAVHTAERAFGRVSYEMGDKEKASSLFRRSLFAVEDINTGELFTNKNVRSIRPANGLPPKFLSQIMGCAAACPISRGTPLSWELVGTRPS
jgi:pseudaminic acid synthase